MPGTLSIVTGVISVHEDKSVVMPNVRELKRMHGKPRIQLYTPNHSYFYAPQSQPSSYPLLCPPPFFPLLLCTGFSVTCSCGKVFPSRPRPTSAATEATWW